jgi:beta-mannosidase
MLRVWGGGFYEDERLLRPVRPLRHPRLAGFHLFVQHLPAHRPDFVDNVRAETADNVRRLRHRASLALWCGNNEME